MAAANIGMIMMNAPKPDRIATVPAAIMPTNIKSFVAGALPWCDVLSLAIALRTAVVVAILPIIHAAVRRMIKC